jgi:D-serine deaminase-like pyridoxal phosphate-dependent protein
VTRLPPALPSLHLLKAVPTPALVVDVPAARENHRRATATLGGGQLLRPHFKAHKCTALARLQAAEGMAAVCCQTAWEATALVAAGFNDIMITNQLVDAASLEEAATAAGSARISALVDDIAHVGLLQAAASRAGSRIEVLIEVDLGMRRCGVPPQSDELLTLAAAIEAAPSLSLMGIQAYDGQVAGMVDPQARLAAARKSAELTRLAVARLTAAGFAVPVVAGCATGHMPFIAELGVWTDIQAGSYLLMDGAYGDCLDVDFDVALLALATVIHRSPERAVLDIGLKQLSVDRGNPAWIGDPAATLRLSDEHTVVALQPTAGLAVGDRTFILPRHIDPTVNLHSSLWFSDGNTVTEQAIDGRMPAGRSQSFHST